MFPVEYENDLEERGGIMLSDFILSDDDLTLGEKTNKKKLVGKKKGFFSSNRECNQVLLQRFPWPEPPPNVSSRMFWITRMFRIAQVPNKSTLHVPVDY